MGLPRGGGGSRGEGGDTAAFREQDKATRNKPLRFFHGNSGKPPLPRDASLRRVREIGEPSWKVESGYHRRSLAETAMFRHKQIFGEGLGARLLVSQRAEARLRCVAMNWMTALGMPDSYAPVTPPQVPAVL